MRGVMGGGGARCPAGTRSCDIYRVLHHGPASHTRSSRCPCLAGSVCVCVCVLLHIQHIGSSSSSLGRTYVRERAVAFSSSSSSFGRRSQRLQAAAAAAAAYVRTLRVPSAATSGQGGGSYSCRVSQCASG